MSQRFLSKGHLKKKLQSQNFFCHNERPLHQARTFNKRPLFVCPIYYSFHHFRALTYILFRCYALIFGSMHYTGLLNHKSWDKTPCGAHTLYPNDLRFLILEDSLVSRTFQSPRMSRRSRVGLLYANPKTIWEFQLPHSAHVQWTNVTILLLGYPVTSRWANSSLISEFCRSLITDIHHFKPPLKFTILHNSLVI